MIIYFSGTGNSKYVAKRIGAIIDDEVIDLFQKIRDRDHSKMHSDRPWVVVTPTYAWRIPHVVRQWLMNTELSGSNTVYFVMTCGGNICNAEKYIEKLCEAKKLHLMGCKAVVMPENYIAMFQTPTKQEALEIIAKAESVIDETADTIKRDQLFLKPAITVMDRVSSGIVNDVFCLMGIGSRRFRVTDACISCGKCAQVCPLANIELKNGKPVWGKHCTHCMACICRCPSEAIEYGRHTEGLPRYVCPKSDA